MKRVLILEDELWLAELWAAQLAGEYEVLFAAHCQAALARIEEAMPDVLIADMLLTGSTVLPLLHELQTHADTKQIPVVLCSNTVDSIDTTALAPYGVRRVLDKATMEPADIVAAVRGVLV